MTSRVMLFLENLRIEIEQPSIASGGAEIFADLGIEEILESLDTENPG
jgi:hypothetical protein